jgi:hypothetical protein
MKVYLNRDINHLIQRTAERVRANDGTPMRVTVGDFERWRLALESNCPDDWRFTQRASDFILAIVTTRGIIKMLGKSWRWTRADNWLQREISALVNSNAQGESLDQKISQLSEGFLNSETFTDATICHQLSSVLAPWMPPTTDLDRMNASRGKQTVSPILAQSKVERNLAQRPNALLIEDRDGNCEVWVRQGNPYIRAFSGAEKSISFCIFAKLTPDGIDDSVPGQVWKVTGGGALQKAGSAECHPTARPTPDQIPNGFRSVNYWHVPSHLEHWLESLRFGLSREGETADTRDARTDSIIERILTCAGEINEERIGNSAHPAQDLAGAAPTRDGT